MQSKNKPLAAITARLADLGASDDAIAEATRLARTGRADLDPSGDRRIRALPAANTSNSSK